jgi:hypothetical protein
MTQLFEWINKLTYFQGMTILCSVALVMLLIPYFKTITKILILIFKAQKPEIISFEYKMSAAHRIADDEHRELYLLANDQGFIVNGSAIMLSWNVKAVYRVDLLPYGKNLSGNAATVVVNKNNRKFVLVAYTLARGKLTKTIEIPENIILDLKNLKLSRSSEYIHRKLPALKTQSITSFKPNLWNFEFQVFKKLKEKIAILSGKRYQYMNKAGTITENQALDKKVTQYKILKSYDYNLSKYNETYQKSREETKKQFNN